MVHNQQNSQEHPLVESCCKCNRTAYWVCLISLCAELSTKPSVIASFYNSALCLERRFTCYISHFVWFHYALCIGFLGIKVIVSS